MSTNGRKYDSHQAGFSLVELMVVISIVAILSAIGLPSFRALIENQKIRSASSDLYTALVRARSEAIKRNTTVTLSPISGNWASGWQIANPAVSGSYLEEHGSVSNVTITGPGSVTYQSSGRLTNSTNSTFTVSSGTVSSRCVYIDLSGRPAVKSC